MPKGLFDTDNPPVSDVSAVLKSEGTKAPQPVAVDGCGDNALQDDDGDKATSLGEVKTVVWYAWKDRLIRPFWHQKS